MAAQHIYLILFSKGKKEKICFWSVSISCQRKTKRVLRSIKGMKISITSQSCELLSMKTFEGKEKFFSYLDIYCFIIFLFNKMCQNLFVIKETKEFEKNVALRKISSIFFCPRNFKYLIYLIIFSKQRNIFLISLLRWFVFEKNSGGEESD